MVLKGTPITLDTQAIKIALFNVLAHLWEYGSFLILPFQAIFLEPDTRSTSHKITL